MSSEKVEDLERSLQAFKKCANVDMCLSIAYKLKFEGDDIEHLKAEMVEVLAAASKFKEAGDLYC